MTDRIRAALEAADKATPGPWHIGNGKVSDLYQGWNAILANADDGGRFVLATVNHNYEELAKYNAPLIAAAPDLAAEVIRLRKAIIEYEMALASEGALILNHEGHIAKLNAEISRLRKRQSEAMKLIDGCLAMPSELADRLIAEAEEDTND